MPDNLHAMIRIRVIDQCLQRRHRRWTWQQLAEACAERLAEDFGLDRTPSRSLILGDIALMRHGKLGYHAPIRYDRARKGYYYDDPHFSVSNVPVSPEEFEKLRHATLLLKQFRGFDTITGLEEIISRLETAARHRSRTDLREVIQLDRPLQKAGERWVDPLYHHIQTQTCLSLTYQPFYEQEPLQLIVSPYLLREYNRRWFLIAYNHSESAVHTFPLDRILAFTPSGHLFFRHSAFSPEVYYRDVIGVSVPENARAEDILFAATPLQARYIETKPIHHSQKRVGEQAGQVLFSLHVIPNFELESTLLSFGETLSVLQPAWLRERMNQRLQEALKKYRE